MINDSGIKGDFPPVINTDTEEVSLELFLFVLVSILIRVATGQGNHGIHDHGKSHGNLKFYQKVMEKS